MPVWFQRTSPSVSLALLGSTLWPIWIPERRATWAGVFCIFSATEITNSQWSCWGRLGHWPRPGDPGEPKGEKALTTRVRVYRRKSDQWQLKSKCRNIWLDYAKLTERWTPFRLTKLVLLPNQMALNLVDCWRHTCNGEQILQLLTRTITPTDCTSFARAV
jgi:hypothetical protein